MKKTRIHLISLIILLSVSCDFNVTDRPGPQMSASVENSKLHNTFLCEYKLDTAIIKGIGIKSIFAEKQFWREKGLLMRKKIDCCKSQLVIVATQPFVGYGEDWMVKGFDGMRTSYHISKTIEGIDLPDSILLTVILLKEKDSSSSLQQLVIHKIK